MKCAVMAMAVVMAAGAAFGQSGAPAVVVTKAAQENPSEELAKQAKMAEAVRPSLVVVDVALKFDRGDAPSGGSVDSADLVDTAVHDERPVEVSGYAIDGTHVVMRDLQIHPRFIQSIGVRRLDDAAGGAEIGAKISAYPKERNAVILTLDKPLEGVKGLTFADKPGPYWVVRLSHENDESRWEVTVDGFGGSLVMVGGKKLFNPPAGLVVTEDGEAVGMATGTLMGVDGWKGSPLAWPALSAEEESGLIAEVKEKANGAVVRATLNFRSPKNVDPRQMMMMGMGNNDPENATVQYALAVAIDKERVLVLANLRPKVTARLEHIRLATDPPMDATFAGSLRNYGAFVAKTEKPLEAVMPLSESDARELRGRLLAAGDIQLQGDKRISTYQERRLFNFHVGWQGGVCVETPREDKNLFLFGTGGEVAALPVMQRERATMGDRDTQEEATVTSGAALAAALKKPEGMDPANVPLTAEEENRLAWLGVELQPLTPELSRANGVSDQTGDGQNGALVTYVYPESPAAKAGVETGWIILRLHAPDTEFPIDVHIENDPMASEAFPWDRLGDAPEEVFDRIPSPWPPVENALIRTITNLGFGAKYSIDFYHDGKIDTKEFTVAQGPANYASAPQYKSAATGVTVRDMTYEVRRYLQKKPEDPGVVISKIEQGSKASVAGLKPYELITHVNDEPVRSVKDFERLTQGQTEIRLSVKRMTAGRIVKLSLNAPAPTTRMEASPPSAAPAPPGE
ncbi:MAG TPA: PDZ domain-containing protein [Phycisphaerae bacterium]|nr:PDZ domain-containing protein [Phycisphaerae bacterium]